MKTPHADIAGKATPSIFKPLPKYRYVQPAYLTPLPGEYTMKQFCMEVAEVLGITTVGVYNRYARRRLNGIKIRRANAMVVFVRPFVPLPEYLELIRTLEAAEPGCSLVAGGDDLARRPGELTTYEWLKREARRLRTTQNTVSGWLYRGKVAWPPRRRAGQREFILNSARIRRGRSPIAPLNLSRAIN